MAPDLKRFAELVMDRWPEGDVDGGDLQEIALKCGLLRPEQCSEPCDPDGCTCAEYHGTNDDGTFCGAPITCYRRVPLTED